jgi:hypothetical protein
MSQQTPDGESRLQEAARTAIAREERTESPRGEWQDRLWFPAGDERQACCASITPTESNRQALESHCRTQAHIAQLFKVSLPELRRAVKQARDSRDPGPRAAGPALGPRSLASTGSRADILFEASRGAHGDALRELRSEARRFERILPRLILAEETDEVLLDLLDEASVGIERLKLTVEYCRQVETTYDSARAVRDLVSRLFEQQDEETKKSA